MGYAYKENIEMAALHLIKILNEKGQVDFDFFYDGRDITQHNLNNALGFSEERGEAESVAHMDIAIAELESMGIIKTHQLESKLIDDEFNFRISFTDKGKEIIKSGKRLEFVDLDL